MNVQLKQAKNELVLDATTFSCFALYAPRSPVSLVRRQAGV